MKTIKNILNLLTFEEKKKYFIITILLFFSTSLEMVSLAKLNKKSSIDVWGDGEQTRSFMFIKDCIIGTKLLFESNERTVLNIGSKEQVSINQMINLIEEISGYKVNKNYQLSKRLF